MMKNLKSVDYGSLEPLRRAFARAWAKSERANWVLGRLGRVNGDGSITVECEDRPGWVYVRTGSNGNEGLVTAKNVGAAATADLPVKMRRDGNMHVVEGPDWSGNRYNQEALSLPPGGGSGTGVHALNDTTVHTGQLNWSQLNKTGSNLAELTTRAHGSLTGIGANDHHAQAHNIVGGDHTASGLTAGHVLRASSATAFAFAQLQHSDLGGVTANQHHNQQHNIVGSDHTISAAAFSLVGTTATNTLGVLTASADVGTTPAESILKSTNAGGLILGSLGVKGAATVDQDLYAAATAFRVINHTHDYPHAHVVINPTGSWTLDEQFGLDIDDNLLVRGWIVGKHAIQLDECRLILHFDGPERSLDLSGQTRGHLGQVPMLESGITFGAGKFGKAVYVPEATTNLLANPSFEVDTTGWLAYGSGTGTRTRVSTIGYAGNYSLQITKSGGADADHYGTYYSFSVTNGTTYTVSAWVNVNGATGGNRTFAIQLPATGFGSITTQSITGVTDGWVRISVTATATSTTTASVRLFWLNVTTGVAYVDAVQIEAKAYPTAYCDGTLGAGHSWSGTAHASSSSRTAATLDYNTTNAINDDAGTVMAWVYPVAGGVNQVVFSTSLDFWLRAASTGDWILNFGGSTRPAAGTWTAGQWHHVAVTWDGSNAYLYVNGALVHTYSGSGPLNGATSQFSVGRYRPTPNQWWTGMIDDIVIRGKVTTADEVRAIYESNAPVFAETSTWHWRAGRNRFYADAEGMWMLGASGGTIFGAYAGDETDPAATKSWGGLNLSEGDILMGQYGTAKGGWQIFDQDLVGGLPSWRFGYGETTVLALDSGGATLDGVLDLSTSGGIYQGTGTFASPTTGLKLWNQSGIGRIGGYNGGTAQWYADTDGKLYAGAGTVKLDAGGIQITRSTGSSSGAINALSFISGGSLRSALYSFLFGGTENYLLLHAADGDRDNRIDIFADSNAGGDDANASIGSRQANRYARTNYTVPAGATPTTVISHGATEHYFKSHDESTQFAVMDTSGLRMNNRYVRQASYLGLLEVSAPTAVSGQTLLWSDNSQSQVWARFDDGVDVPLNGWGSWGLISNTATSGTWYTIRTLGVLATVAATIEIRSSNYASVWALAGQRSVGFTATPLVEYTAGKHEVRIQNANVEIRHLEGADAVLAYVFSGLNG